MSITQAIIGKIFKSAENISGEREMSFLDHLDELRKQIIKMIVGILIGTALCIYFADFIVQTLLLTPLRSVGLKAQVLSPYGIVMLYMEAILICGIILSMPYTIYCLWKFVAPGLLPKERQYISRIVFFTSLCFFSGILFGYYVLLPAALTFFSTFGTQNIELHVALDQYVSFMLALLLGAGLVFELPMISFFLSKMGLLTPQFMRKYRRHAIIVILIISAVVTPTPDMVTQTLLALPMLFLYEVSIFVSKFAQKKKSPPLEDTL
ncbi:MAG: twin-arginine translocase subunit TatC [Ignavibacteriae bacterium]|nr:MAG: twin-arginine translocase subunit TatC [Ignavibacteriota bacterium]